MKSQKDQAHLSVLYVFLSAFLLIPVFCLVFCSGGDTANPLAQDQTYVTFDDDFVEASPQASLIEEKLSELYEKYRDSVSAEVLSAVSSVNEKETVLAKSTGVLSDSGSLAGDTLIAMGVEAVLSGSMKTALLCFLRAAEINPECPWYLSKCGFALKHRKQYADARSVLLYARELDGNYHETHANLAGVYQALGDTARAIYEWRRALLQYPGNYMYHLELGNIYEQQGVPGSAYREYARAAQLAPHLDTIQTMISALGDTANFSEQDMPDLPGPGDDLDPSIQDDDITTIGDTINLVFVETDSVHMPVVGEYIGDAYLIEQNFLNKVSESAAILSDCGSFDAGCLSEDCSRCQSALAEAKGAMYENSVDGVDAYNAWIRDLFENTMAVYYRNPDAVDLDMTYYLLQERIRALQGARNSVYPNAQADIELWEADVVETCTDAAQAIEDARQDSIEAAQRGESGDFEVCFIMVCFGNSGDKISFSLTYGFGSFGLDYDMEKSVIGVSAGVSLYGCVGMGLNINSAGEAKITTSAKMPLPIGIKYSPKASNISLY